MSLMGYPALTSGASEDYRQHSRLNWLFAAAFIGGGSLAIWGLIVYAVWQLT